MQRILEISMHKPCIQVDMSPSTKNNPNIHSIHKPYIQFFFRVSIYGIPFWLLHVFIIKPRHQSIIGVNGRLNHRSLLQQSETLLTQKNNSNDQ